MIYLGKEQVHLNGHSGQKMMYKGLSRSLDFFPPKVTTTPNFCLSPSVPSFRKHFLRTPSQPAANTGPDLLTTVMPLLCLAPHYPVSCMSSGTWAVLLCAVSSQLHHQVDTQVSAEWINRSYMYGVVVKIK